LPCALGKGVRQRRCRAFSSLCRAQSAHGKERDSGSGCKLLTARACSSLRAGLAVAAAARAFNSALLMLMLYATPLPCAFAALRKEARPFRSFPHHTHGAPWRATTKTHCPARPVGISLTKRFATCWLLPLLLPGSVQLASVRPSVRPGGQIDTETFRDPPRE
jgi:hypothetical protein